MRVMIKAIRQMDKSHFEIVWTDDCAHIYPLTALQSQCPCSLCLEKQPEVLENVSAEKVVSVGSYALRVEFTSGCSRGIYTYPFLRSLGEAL